MEDGPRIWDGEEQGPRRTPAGPGTVGQTNNDGHFVRSDPGHVPGQRWDTGAIFDFRVFYPVDPTSSAITVIPGRCADSMTHLLTIGSLWLGVGDPGCSPAMRAQRAKLQAQRAKDNLAQQARNERRPGSRTQNVLLSFFLLGSSAPDPRRKKRGCDKLMCAPGMTSRLNCLYAEADRGLKPALDEGKGVAKK